MRKNPLTATQLATCYAMQAARHFLDISGSIFALRLVMTRESLAKRDAGLLPWKPSELERAQAYFRAHLSRTLSALAMLDRILVNDPHRVEEEGAPPSCAEQSKPTPSEKEEITILDGVGYSSRRDKAGRTLQPIIIDDCRVRYFKPNAIVQFLLAEAKYDMGRLALRNFTDEDRAQFAQLIGYSVSEWENQKYVEPGMARHADAIADQVPTLPPV